MVYVSGDVDIVFDFDPDYLYYLDIEHRYQNQLGYPNMKRIFILELGKKLENGLFLVHDDASIRKVLNYINKIGGYMRLNSM